MSLAIAAPEVAPPSTKFEFVSETYKLLGDD